MLRNVRHHRQRRWLGVMVLAVALAGMSASAFADDPVPDKTGAFQTTPSAYTVPGYTKPDPAKATTKDLAVAVDAVAQSASHGIYSVNFVWTLVAGFLVMFMQAGFALVETGLIRAKNAAHTMSMNFMVYGIGMIGFFICGFAFMCGGANGTAIGGPASLGGTPTLHSMLTIGSAINGDHGWGLLGTTGFFLTGNGYDAAAIVWFLFMMVFMDTTATIVTGACAERWSFKSFCIFSLFVGAVIYPIFGGWVWGGGWLAQLGYRAGHRPRSGRLRRLRRRPPARRRAGVHHGDHDRPPHRKVRRGRQDQSHQGAQRPDGHAGDVHPGLRLVRVQRRQLAGGLRRPHRHHRHQHHAGQRVRCGLRDALRLVHDRQAGSDHDVQRHAGRTGGHHLAVRLRHAGGRVHHRLRVGASWSS